MRVVIERTEDSMTTVEHYVEGEPELCIVQQGVTTQVIAFQTVENAIKAAMALLELAGWQPMETAPRDGSWILGLLLGGKSYEVVSACTCGMGCNHWLLWDKLVDTKSLLGWLPLPKMEEVAE